MKVDELSPGEQQAQSWAQAASSGQGMGAGGSGLARAPEGRSPWHPRPCRQSMCGAHAVPDAELVELGSPGSASQSRGALRTRPARGLLLDGWGRGSSQAHRPPELPTRAAGSQRGLCRRGLCRSKALSAHGPPPQQLQLPVLPLGDHRLSPRRPARVLTPSWAVYVPLKTGL